ncbi:MAG: hypothetical protein M1818_008545 [Claussenomyces sp. TS43310]|nr:MAG: hypothetical protein M1818_008545 [Claussenomyces sp. TS43310]
MALDLTINGNPKSEVPSHEPDTIIAYTNGSIDLPTSTSDSAKNAQKVDDILMSNMSEPEPETSDAPVVSQVTEESMTFTDAPESHSVSASISATSTNAAGEQLSLDADVHPLIAREEQLDQVLDLPPATSSVLSLVDAQESDVREEVIPATEAQADEVKADTRNSDLIVDSNLTTGIDSAQSDVNDNTDKSGLLTPAEDRPVQGLNVSDLDLTSHSQNGSATNMAEVSQAAQTDVDMADAPPPSPSKIAREREEEHEDQPSAKRAKVEGSTDAEPPQFAIPDAPAPVNGAEPVGQTPSEDAPPTEYQLKEILKAVRHYKGTVHGRSFKAPVAVLWPNLAAQYAEKVSNPIDLATIDQRIKDKHYKSVADLKTDINLIYNNAVLFNGVENPVTKSAEITRDFLLGKIPGPEPPKQEKKPKKATPVPDSTSRATAARRQSRVAAASPPTAAAAPAAAPAQTFALDPSGTPLIRRDSTKTADGGRPKREIHPPRSKDLVYSARPKKKKFATELKFCDEVLTEIKKAKYTENLPFLVPVDPVALNVPDYFKIIKTPMDLQTVTTHLHSGQYESAKDFENDMRLILKNCFKFNPPGSPVHDIGKKFEALFENEWSKKARYVADHTSNAASPASTVDTEDEESEEEEIPEEPISAASNVLALRLIEEQNKLIDIMGAKNPNEVLVRMQQDMVALIKKEIDKENSKLVKKAKPAKASKKASSSTKKKSESKRGYRPKHIGQAEKEQISNGIAALVGKEMDQAIALLKVDFPNLNLEEELELDIDQFSALTLSKLHDLIAKTHPEIVRTAALPPQRASKPSKPKKNKPMNRREQEAKIEHLKHLKQTFERPGSASDDARVVPSVEQDQSSGDEESSDSEED